jgi:hypothetical protein
MYEKEIKRDRYKKIYLFLYTLLFIYHGHLSTQFASNFHIDKLLYKTEEGRGVGSEVGFCPWFFLLNYNLFRKR